MTEGWEMQAFMRLTQSKVLPVIFLGRGHGQSDRLRRRIKNAGGGVRSEGVWKGERRRGGGEASGSQSVQESENIANASQELLNVFQGK